jgi:hypothetical protein
MADMSEGEKELCSNLRVLEGGKLFPATAVGMASLLRTIADAVMKDDLSCKLSGKEFPFQGVAISLIQTRKNDKHKHMIAAFLANEIDPVLLINALEAVVRKFKNVITDDVLTDMFKGNKKLLELYEQFKKEKNIDV